MEKKFLVLTKAANTNFSYGIRRLKQAQIGYARSVMGGILYLLVFSLRKSN